MTSTYESLKSRMDFTITEFPSDPDGDPDGPTFRVTAAWKDGAPINADEWGIPMAVSGWGNDRESAASKARLCLQFDAAQLDRRREYTRIVALGIKEAIEL